MVLANSLVKPLSCPVSGQGQTAAPMNQNNTLASRPADQPEGWACDREFS